MEKTNTVIILGSSRSHGETRQVCDFIVEKTGFDLIDLNQFDFSYYDYEHRNAGDDFLPLMERIIEKYDHIYLATPEYWYTMSAVMKNFLDRLSDLLTIRKDLGRRLRGRAMGLISCAGHDVLKPGFEMPFEESAKYLGMKYLGHLHAWVEAGKIASVGKQRIVGFFNQKMAASEI